MSRLSRLAGLVFLGAAWAQAQSPEIRAILDRLDRLEQENRALVKEVRDLKGQLAAAQPAPGAAPLVAAASSAIAAPSVSPSATAASSTTAPASAVPSATAAPSSAPAPSATTAPGPAPSATAPSSALAPSQSATAAQSTPAPSAPTESSALADLEEKVEIQGARVEEQAQTKVEASQKFPIQITGMALFNTFLNSRQNGGADYPTAAYPPGPEHDGASLRQTTIGLEFHGPQAILGATVQGSIYMDFYNTPQWIRLRTGSIELDWKSRSILVGIEKPIFNPREPSSLAQVGVSPLTGAGNLWLWLPQVRLEQDVKFTANTGIRARLGVVQTHELGPYDTSQYTGPAPEASRPGLEGRFEFFHNFDDTRRFEIAPGFHTSTTHVGGFSIPSNLVSADWFFNPVQRVEFAGAFFSGQNVAHLGTGAITEGYIAYGRSAYAIYAIGGWGQFTVHAARRLDAHLFTGQQQYSNSRLGSGDLTRNLMFGANLFFHLAPNVILGPEISQLRSAYIRQGTRINNHYDLALAYLF